MRVVARSLCPKLTIHYKSLRRQSVRHSRSHASAMFLAATLAGCAGCCAPWCPLSDQCACGPLQCDVLRAIDDLCSYSMCYDCGEEVGCGCGVRVTEDAVFIDEPCAPGRLACRPRVERGPPPVSYQPPMPPKFLPVPTRLVFTGANMLAPTPTRGAVELGNGPQLTFPGRN